MNGFYMIIQFNLTLGTLTFKPYEGCRREEHDELVQSGVESESFANGPDGTDDGEFRTKRGVKYRP